MKKILTSTLFAFSLAGCSYTPTQPSTIEQDAQPFSQGLPLDPNLTTTTLKNGLQLAVLNNAHPADQVSLKLIVKAGSLHEQDDQKGIAHLVEHMAFNGTAKYPGNRIIERQEEMGMVFGRDVNATTSYDTTSYYLHLPNIDQATLDEAMMMLSQQASALTFSTEELEKERPVVEEEWRRTLSARARLRKARQHITLAGSRYQVRAPIGDMELVRHVDVQRIKAFWQDWYQPNNMVLIAVGSASLEQIEQLAQKYFGSLPSNPLPPRPDKHIPLPQTLTFDSIADKEVSTESVSVSLRTESLPVTTEALYRKQLLARLAISVASDRLRNLYQSGGKHLSHISISTGSSFPGYNNTNLFGIFKDEDYAKGLAELFTEISRLSAHGFKKSDLTPVREDMIKRLQTKLQNISKVENSRHLHRLSAAISKELPITSPEQMANLGIKLLQGLKVSEVNRYLKAVLSQRTPVVITQIKPENQVKMPTTKSVANSWQTHIDNPPAPVSGIKVDRPLFKVDLPPVDIVEHKQLDDMHVWILSNNTQVWFQPSTRSQETLRLSWQGEGGTASLPLELRRAAMLATRSMYSFGYAGFDPLQLGVLNSGKSINLAASVTQNHHQLSGSSSKDSYEAWLQNLYLQITQPQTDAAIWASKKQLMIKGLKGASRSPERLFSNKLNAHLYINNPELKPLTEEELNPISADDLLVAWRDVFGSAQQHHLLVVGNADPQWVINTTARYIGNLPQGQHQSAHQLPKLNSTRENIELAMGTEPKATSQFMWIKPANYSETLRRELGVLSRILNIKLREQLREKSAGVYTSHFSMKVDRYRSQQVSSLNYAHQPARAEELTNTAMSVITQVTHTGISAADLDKVRDQLKLSLRTENISDSTRMAWLARHAKEGNYHRMPAHYLNWLEQLTPSRLTQLARLYLSEQPTLAAQLKPESE